MSTDAADIQVLSQRVERLERQNRRLKASGLVVLAVFGAFLLMRQAAPGPQTITARRFVIEDEQGKVRAELGMFPNEGKLDGIQSTHTLSPALRLFDDQGRMGVDLHDYLFSGALLLGFEDKPAVTVGAGPYILLGDKERTASEYGEYGKISPSGIVFTGAGGPQGILRSDFRSAELSLGWGLRVGVQDKFVNELINVGFDGPLGKDRAQIGDDEAGQPTHVIWQKQGNP